jgi:hypothetical protein
MITSPHHLRIRFTGFWSEYNCGLMPRRSGIFCVYRARFDGIGPAGAVRMLELLHVGASEDVNRCLCEEVDRAHWRADLAPQEALMFSYGALAPADLARGEEALVRHHRPRFNAAPQGSFPYGYVAVTLHRHVPMLQRHFAVGIAPQRSLALRALDLIRRGIDLTGWVGRLN